MGSTKAVRIKLRFEEPGILSKLQREQGLDKCWYLVRPELLSISDIDSDITSAFNLNKSCPHGIFLEMGGFFLPRWQPANLLQDSDIVSVKRISGIGSVTGEVVTNSGSAEDEEDANGIRFGGVKLRALDEFEKETGGYQSEGEEETDPLLGSTIGWKLVATERVLSPSRVNKKSGKKRKRAHTIDKLQGDVVGATALWEVNGGREDVDVEEIGKERVLCKLHDNKEKAKGSGRKVDWDVGSKKLAHQSKQVGEESSLKDKPKNVHVTETEKKTTTKKKKKKKEKKSEPKCAADSQEGNEQVHAQVEDGRIGRKRKLKGVQEMEDDRHQPALNLEIVDNNNGVVKETVGNKDECAEKLSSGHRRPKKHGQNAGLEAEKAQVKPAVQSGSGEKQELETTREINTAGSGYVKEGERKGKRSKTAQADVVQDQQIVGSKCNKKQSKEDSAINGVPDSFKVQENKTVPEEEGSADPKRPSRSARRKQAKRRWLREQAQTGVPLGPKDEDAKQIPNLYVPEASEKEEEAEAEEERLPIMVAPGHLRFEPHDEDDGEHLLAWPLSVPSVRNDIQNKRQGQGWGQEEPSYKCRNTQNNSARKFTEEVAALEADQIKFEELPLLEGIPQEGDILAYRLVELTQSWTPELSTYRVGKVSECKGSGMVTLVAVPEYPLVALDAQQDEMFSAPYNTDGSLEVEVVALVEVRVIEKGPNPALSEPQALVPDCLDGVGSASIPSHATAQEGAESKSLEFNQDVGGKATLRCNGADVKCGTQTKPEMVDTAAARAGTPFMSDAAWQDILSVELDKKKLELSGKLVKRNGKSLGTPNTDMPTQTRSEQVEQRKGIDGVADAEELGVEREGDCGAPLAKNAEPQFRHRFLRAGALGPTISLLRASQAL